MDQLQKEVHRVNVLLKTLTAMMPEVNEAMLDPDAALRQSNVKSIIDRYGFQLDEAGA